MDLDELALELPNVPDIAQVAVKHHHREWTLSVVLAEIQKMRAASCNNFQDLRGNTDSRPRFVFGLFDGNAFAMAERCKQRDRNKSCDAHRKREARTCVRA